jgi:predicted RNA-binding protein with RPS1 domain
VTKMNLTTLKENARRYKWQISAATILLLLLIFLWVLPLIISAQFQKWVLENGGEDVSVEDVDFNLFTAHFRIQNVLIKRAGYEPLLLPVLEVKGNLSDLPDKRFVITMVSIQGLNLTVDYSNPESEHVGGILIQKLTSTEPTAPDEDEKPWSFKVQKLTLLNSQLTYKHTELESSLTISKLTLDDLDNLPNAGQANLHFNGAIDESALELIGKLDLFSGEPGFAGNLSLKSFNADPYLAFLTGQPGRKALVSINTELAVRQLANGGLVASQQGEFAIAQLKLPEETINLGSDQLTWNGNLEFSMHESQQIETSGKGDFRLAGFNLQQANTLKLQADPVAWQGRFDVKLAADTKIIANLDGIFSTEKMDFVSPEQDIRLQNEKISWQGKLGLDKSADQLIVSADGNILNKGMDLFSSGKDLHLQNTELKWQGQIAVNQSAGQLDFTADGNLVNQSFALEKPVVDVKLVNDNLSWQGNAGVSFNGENMHINATSEMQLNKLSMSASGQAERLLLLDEARLEQVAISSLEDLKLEKALFKGLSLGSLPKVKKVPADLTGFANYDQLEFDKISFNQAQGVSIGRIAQSGVEHVVLKDASGEWMFFSLLRTLRKITGNTQDEQPEKSENTSSETIAFSVDRLETTDPGIIHYIDESMPGTFAQKIMVDRFSLSNIDSASNEDSKLDLVAKINDAKAVVKGSIKLFDQNRDFQMTTSITALSLLPYSYFVEKSLGYQVDSGSLNAKGTYKASNAVLESSTELTLHGLDVRALSEAELKKLDAKQNSGLETGLSMLKDNEDTIQLNIPVNGKFDDIKVDPSDIINQAMGAALKTGAKTYLAAALFPFGTLLVVADAVGSRAMQIHLDPVFFAPEQVTLETNSIEYLKKIAQVLDEKPEIAIKVCGVAVSEDSIALTAKQEKVFKEAQEKQKKTEDEKKPEAPKFQVDQAQLDNDLKALARNRAEKVSRHLIDKLSVKPERLVPCQPRMDIQDKATKPRTELSI